MAFPCRTIIVATLLTLVFAPGRFGLAQTPGELDRSFRPELDGPVYALALQPDGRILVGGDFQTLNGQARRHLARLHPDGSLDLEFKPDTDGPVYAFLVLPDGQIFVGGRFTILGGSDRHRLALLHPDGTLVTDYRPHVDGPVYCLGGQPDGKILVGGNFNALGGAERSSLARLLPDRSLDPEFVADCDGTVQGLAVQPDGAVVVAGSFSMLGTSARANTGRLLPDAAVDPEFRPDPNGAVGPVVVQLNGRILLGGAFYHLANQSRHSVARLLPQGSLDSPFAPDPDSEVYALGLQANGQILVGGEFSLLDGQEHAGLGRLDPEGHLDITFHPNPDAAVLALAQQGDGKILLGGTFASVDGVNQRFLARLANNPAPQSLRADGRTRVEWIRDGTCPETSRVSFELSSDAGKTWTGLGAGNRIAGGWELTGLALPVQGIIRARAAVASGRFNGSAGWVESQAPFGFGGPELVLEQPVGTDRENGATVDFASVNLEGSVALSMVIRNSGLVPLTGIAVTIDGPDAGQFRLMHAPAESLASEPAFTTFVVAFAPTSLGLKSATLRVLSNDPDDNPFDLKLSGMGREFRPGDVDPSFQATVNDAVYGMAVQANRRVVLGGRFTSVEATAGRHLARWMADGTVEAGFAPVVSNNVFCTAVQADNKILLGGSFTGVDDVAVRHLARLNANGALDTTFQPDPNGIVHCLLFQTPELTVLGGRFTELTGGEYKRNRLARLYADGTVDPGFNPNANDWVLSAAVQTDGMLVVGGRFTAMGGVTRHRLARLHANGTLDLSFDPGADDTVLCVAVQADGKILVGGGFDFVGGFPRLNLARLRPDGLVDAEFHPDVNGAVSSLGLQADGKILLGGEFTLVEGTPRYRIARLHPNGTLDTESGFAPAVDGEVHGVALQADGRVLIGGEFEAVGTTQQSFLARLHNGAATQEIPSPRFGHVEWRRGGTTPELAWVTFELSTGGGEWWTPLGFGVRTPTGWEIAGLNLPTSGLIRARGPTAGGLNNGSCGWVESVASYGGRDIAVGRGFDVVETSWNSNVEDHDFGSRAVGGASWWNFTIKNVGDLDLSELAIVIDGPHASEFHLHCPSPLTVLSPGQRMTCDVEFVPLTPGSKTATMHIRSDDPDENPVDIALSGTAWLNVIGEDFQLDLGRPVEVAALALQPDGRILVGGAFGFIGSPAATNLIRVRPDGTVDPGFHPTFNGAVSSLALQPDGKILVGGDFRSINAAAREHIARLLPDGNLDPSFDPGADSTVRRIALQREGGILVAGFFKTIAGQLRRGFGRLNPDGSLDPGFDPDPNGVVDSIAVQSDGKILIGGGFSTVAGGFRSSVARLLPDGSLDPDFVPLVEGPVSSIAVQADGKILLGGQFDGFGPTVGLARLLADGTPDSSSFTVYKGGAVQIALQADGMIMARGAWDVDSGGSDGQYDVNLARFHADGQHDFTFADGIWDSTQRPRTALALQADGKVLVANSVYPEFLPLHVTSILRRLHNHPATQTLIVADNTRVEWLRGGASPETPRTSFALSTDGGNAWTPLGFGTRIPGGWQLGGLHLPGEGLIRARARVGEGEVETVTSFHVHLPELALEQPVGTSLSQGATRDFGTVWVGDEASLVFTIRNTGPGDLMLSGQSLSGPDATAFRVAGAPATPIGGPTGSATFEVRFAPSDSGPRTARLLIPNNDADESAFEIILTGTGVRPSGALDPTFNLPADNEVSCFALQPDGGTLLGGWFTRLATSPQEYLGRLRPDGSLDATWAPALDGGVSCLAILPDGSSVVGGFFNAIDGKARPSLARFFPDGRVDSTFRPEPDGGVLSLALESSGDIFLAGWFTTVNGQPHQGVARIRGDGELDGSFNPGLDGPVLSLAIPSDGRLLMGGGFTAVAGEPRPYLARLDSEGHLDPSFDPAANGGVNCVQVQADRKILAGGWFTSMQGQPRRFLARFHDQGQLDSSFNPDPDGPVYTSVLQADGKILIGGWFARVGGQPRHHLARLHRDGSLDDSFRPNADSVVTALTLQADGKLLLGGLFTTLDGVPRAGLGRLVNDPATESLAALNGSHARWLRGGAAPEAQAVWFDQSTDGGATWSALGTGTRTVGGWELVGAPLPSGGKLRARARVGGGLSHGSSGWVQTMIDLPYFATVGEIVAAGDQLRFQVSTVPGRTYHVQYAPNLDESVPWQTVRTILGNGTVLEFSFTMNPSGSGYYRVLEE